MEIGKREKCEVDERTARNNEEREIEKQSIEQVKEADIEETETIMKGLKNSRSHVECKIKVEVIMHGGEELHKKIKCE